MCTCRQIRHMVTITNQGWQCSIAACYIFCNYYTLLLCHPHFWLATNCCCNVGTCSLAGILKQLAGLLLHSWLAGMGHCRSPARWQAPAGWRGGGWLGSLQVTKLVEGTSWMAGEAGAV